LSQPSVVNEFSPRKSLYNQAGNYPCRLNVTRILPFWPGGGNFPAVGNQDSIIFSLFFLNPDNNKNGTRMFPSPYNN
jgi:hypothetical protein